MSDEQIPGPAPLAMSPKEAMALGRLLTKREQIEAEMNGVVDRAKARLGIDGKTLVDVDLDGCVYRVMGGGAGQGGGGHP